MAMSFEQKDPPADEREIRSLSDRSGVELRHVRALFDHEFARLGMGAKVGSYLAVLTSSNVRAMLRRAAARRAALSNAELAQDPSSHDRSGPQDARNIPPALRRWEDDGGSMRAR